jgi:HNH endonuclease
MSRPAKPLIDLLHDRATRWGDCLVYRASPRVERPQVRLAGTRPARYEYVYRVAYALAYGPIPEGYDVHHSCGNPRCIEPEHLFAMTRGEHARAHVVESETCKHGHAWTPENTYVAGHTVGGRPIRRCRRCRSLAQAATDRARRRKV